MTRKVVVVGAKVARQGTGPFVARAFHHLGAEVCAVVGTSPETVGEARQRLAALDGVFCNGYLDLDWAISSERADTVAICSPYPQHDQHIAIAAARNCSVLVEKPLVWPGSEQQLAELLAPFNNGGPLLQMVTQWPLSLAAFAQIHGKPPASVSEFAMGLSPISIGPAMIPDSAPHFISMLQALLGPGECENVGLQKDGESRRATLSCDYRHQSGSTRSELRLETCETRPRPAWYQINGKRVDREVELPAYTQSLVSEEYTAPMADPMEGVVGHFLDSLAKGKSTDVQTLLGAHRNLQQLSAAWPESE